MYKRKYTAEEKYHMVLACNESSAYGAAIHRKMDTTRRNRGARGCSILLRGWKILKGCVTEIQNSLKYTTTVLEKEV